MPSLIQREEKPEKKDHDKILERGFTEVKYTTEVWKLRGKKKRKYFTLRKPLPASRITKKYRM